MRPEARGQRPDPNPDPGNQSEGRTDRISMYNLQKHIEVDASNIAQFTSYRLQKLTYQFNK